MKIQHKITLVSSSLFGIVFLLAAVVIYYTFYNSSQRIFYGELARTAKIAGMFYLEKDELSKKQYEPIEKAFYNLSPDQKISIYDERGNIAFDTKKEDKEIVAPRLNEIRKKGILNFKKGPDYYHGLFYEDNQGDFVVLVKAQSPLIYNQLKNLLFILLLSFLAGMVILVFFTSWLSKLAYKPVRHTIRQVNTLNLNKKPLLLDYKPTKDELEELFVAFNGLLREIEQTYEQQKNFVDYASHELKTPLAGIINQLEVVLKQERSSGEYQETAETALHEAERLQEILKNLLTFSSLNRVSHQKKDIRIDELVWDIIEQLSPAYKGDKFEVGLSVPPPEFNVLNFKGNPTLLAMALYNLIDNAAKFSEEKAVNIAIKTRDQRLLVQIKDRGIGMNPQDLKLIGRPFYRAQNANHFDGSGLGLTIALKILELHHIDISFESETGSGTTIVLTFPQMESNI